MHHTLRYGRHDLWKVIVYGDITEAEKATFRYRAERNAINCSSKKRFCASAYFLALQRLFVRGEKAAEKLRTPADHGRILEQLRDADAVVFGLPLYVDGIPSHVLRRMGSFIRRGACSGKKYTRMLIPSFIFILFADAFFIIVSFFEGGLFRGWLAKKGIE